MQPILEVQPIDPDDADKTDFVIRVFPLLPAGVFKWSKLAPTRNNLRRAKAAEALERSGATASG